MHLRRFISRYGISVLVCALALGVLSLGAAAKRSQYQPHPGLANHLSQAVKMSNDGAQTSADFDCAVPALPLPQESTAAPRVVVPAAAAPRPALFLTAFRFRPPPSS